MVNGTLSHMSRSYFMSFEPHSNPSFFKCYEWYGSMKFSPKIILDKIRPSTPFAIERISK